MADRPVTISLLGALRFERDGQTIREMAAAQSRALLLYLLLAEAPVERDVLCGLLWPEVPEAKAKLRLRVALARLRDALPGRIQSDRRSVSCSLMPDDHLDLVALEPKLEALASGTATASEIGDLQGLLEGLRGDLAEDLEVPETESYRSWLAAARAEWDARIALALGQAAQLAAAIPVDQRGKGEPAAQADERSDPGFRRPIAWLQEALRHDPIDEPLARQLMLELARSGEAAAALDVYSKLRDALETALGLPPERPTQALQMRIRAALARDERHRLPPIERELPPGAEVERLAAWLADPGRRLISLIAAPGPDRAALARAAIEPVLDRFLDGILWLPGRSGNAGRGLEDRLHDALEAWLGPIPAGSDLADWLSSLECLIVLEDGDADPDSAALIGRWLEAGPGLRWLVLGAEPLGLISEQRFSLRIEAADRPPRSDGVALQLRLLGPMGLSLGGRPLPLPAADKSRALLAYLALEGRPISREQVCALLWPEAAPERARASLRVALNQLRSALPERIHSEGDRLRLLLQPGDGVDLLAFLEDSAEGADPSAIRRAVEGYPAAFLEGLEIPDCADFEAWRQRWRERLDARARDAWLLLAARARPDRSAEVLIYLQGAQAIDPLYEPSQCALMLALARAGRHGAALAQFARLQAGLGEAYGVGPSSAVLALRERILAARTREGPRALPQAATPFVGREPEIDRVIEALCEPARPPVTIVGPGGIGKTRLSIEVARRVEEGFLDGVRFVALADLSPDAGIAHRLAMELGLKRVGAEAPLDQVKEALRELEILILLDNFETVLEQAEVVAELLAAGEGVRILATSREPLGLAGERIVRVGGLSFPRAAGEDAQAEAHGAVALFVAAARRVKPDFDAAREAAAIGQLCRQVQGYPLALELAAPWVAESDCSTIALRLASDLAALPSARGLPDRHTSLEAVFEHTWQSLDGATRLAFTRLCVFQGSFDPEAALAVAGLDAERLADLVHRSLVADLGDGRFAIHTVLRHFGVLRLEGNAAIALRLKKAHAQHYLERFRATSLSQGTESRALVAWVESDAENLIRAWQSAVELRSLDGIAAVAVDLASYYYAQGPNELGLRVCREGIACCQATSSREQASFRIALAARLTAERGFFELRADQVESAVRSADRALDLLDGPPEPDSVVDSAQASAARAAALRLRGILHRNAGAFDAATDDLDRAVAEAQEAGEERLAAEAAYHRAGIEIYRGEVEACLASTQSVLESIAGRGYLRLECAIHFTLSVLQDRGGDTQAAMASSRRCLAIAEAAAYHLGEMNAASSVGQSLYRQGQLSESLGYMERATRLAVELGHRATERNARLSAAIALTDLGRRAEASFQIESVRKQSESLVGSRNDATMRLRLAYLQRAAQEGRAAKTHAEAALETLKDLGDEAHVALALAEIGRAAAMLGEHALARGKLDRAIETLTDHGEHTQCLIARLDRAALPLEEGEAPIARRRELQSIRDAAVSAKVEAVVPAIDLVLGRLLCESDPEAAEASLRRSLDLFQRMGLAHRALEPAAALARLLRQRGDADRARGLVDAHLDTVYRHRLFGLAAAQRTLEDLRSVLASLDHPRAAELENWIEVWRKLPTMALPS